uniref:glycogen/starch synthase n=1 Tax=Klebsiella pneumoniae TaxID=573 RepID=UPI001CED0E10
MQVLHVCSEMFPLLKTGGLADVIGALPAAQIAEGIDTRVLLPAFPDIRRGVVDAQVVTRRDTFAGRITLLYGHFNGVGIYLIDAPHLYDRPGSPYHDTNQHAYTDNVLRFALLGWAQIAEGIDTRVLLPAFPDIRRGVVDAQVVTRRDTFAGRITLLYGHFNGVGIYLIDAPHLYDRPGSPYH